MRVQPCQFQMEHEFEWFNRTGTPVDCSMDEPPFTSSTRCSMTFSCYIEWVHLKTQQQKKKAVFSLFFKVIIININGKVEFTAVVWCTLKYCLYMCVCVWVCTVGPLLPRPYCPTHTAGHCPLLQPESSEAITRAYLILVLFCSIKFSFILFWCFAPPSLSTLRLLLSSYFLLSGQCGTLFAHFCNWNLFNNTSLCKLKFGLHCVVCWFQSLSSSFGTTLAQWVRCQHWQYGLYHFSPFTQILALLASVQCVCVW